MITLLVSLSQESLNSLIRKKNLKNQTIILKILKVFKIVRFIKRFWQLSIWQFDVSSGLVKICISFLNIFFSLKECLNKSLMAIISKISIQSFWIYLMWDWTITNYLKNFLRYNSWNFLYFSYYSKFLQ